MPSINKAYIACYTCFILLSPFSMFTIIWFLQNPKLIFITSEFYLVLRVYHQRNQRKHLYLFDKSILQNVFFIRLSEKFELLYICLHLFKNNLVHFFSLEIQKHLCVDDLALVFLLKFRIRIYVIKQNSLERKPQFKALIYSYCKALDVGVNQQTKQILCNFGGKSFFNCHLLNVKQILTSTLKHFLKLLASIFFPFSCKELN